MIGHSRGRLCEVHHNRRMAGEGDLQNGVWVNWAERGVQKWGATQGAAGWGRGEGNASIRGQTGRTEERS